VPCQHPTKPASLALAISVAITATWGQPSRADGLGAIVKAVCLSAFETEMSQVGKVPPAGMASYACACVEQRIRAGGGIESARSACKEATAQRFPI
jgi:hypothetical protein